MLPKRHGYRRPPPSWALLALTIFAACSHGFGDDRNAAHAPASSDADERRNILDMMKAKYGHQACGADSACPFGTYCKSGSCTYECVSSDGCDAGLACNDAGVCVADFAISRHAVDMTNPLCANKSPAEIIDALEKLNGKQMKCSIDAECICGSFCNNNSGYCQVNCIDGDQTGNYECIEQGETCNSIGLCVTGSNSGPTAQLTLGISPTVISGDTYASSVLVEVSVSVDALGSEVVQTHNPHPAKVRYHFAGIDDTTLPNTPDSPAGDPANEPKIKCSAGAALATSCELDGGWQFTSGGGLHATPRTIWVELPKSTTLRTWNLVATSDWAAEPSIVQVAAAPVVPPPTIAGHYTGQLTMTHAGAPLTVPVDAVVTDGYIALIEPSKIFLPDGHAVFSRSSDQATMLSWLTSTTGGASYEVRIQLGSFSRDTKTGKLNFDWGVTTTGTDIKTPIGLTLNRIGDIEPNACTTGSCGTDQYCDSVLKQCLPGSGAAAGARIVTATTQPSITLPSSQVTAWSAPLTALAAAHPGVLNLSGTDGINAAYCAHTAIDSVAPSFNQPPYVKSEVSLDSECALNGTSYVQQTFPFTERTQEVETGAGNGDSFELSKTCWDELSASPAAALSDAKCVSIARFFLALKANVKNEVGTTGSDSQQRIIWQILRQWLSVNTYLASTAVRLKSYHDILDSNTGTELGLAQVADRVEDSLRVLLDPTIRGQFATGTAIDQVSYSPDYRNMQRPVIHWSFNDSGSPFSDPEGGNPFTSIGDRSSDARCELYYDDNLREGVQTLTSTYGVDLDYSRFSIVAHLQYYPTNLVTPLIWVTEGLTLSASSTDYGQHLRVEISDESGGIARFEPIPWDVDNGGFIAAVSDGSSYYIYTALPGRAPASYKATSVDNGGPQWIFVGPVELQSHPSAVTSCTSWDRYSAGDHLAVGIQPPKQDSTTTQTQACTAVSGHTACFGPIPQQATCDSLASTRKSDELSHIPAGSRPEDSVNLDVSATLNYVDIQKQKDPESGGITTTTRWNCLLQLSGIPYPLSGPKPVCGADSNRYWVRWDEVSLWSRAVPLDEFARIATNYGNNACNEVLQATPVFNQKDDQRVGLPVYLLEAANAQLELLTRYLEEASTTVYAQCYTGNSSTERDIATERVGRNLRLLAIVEDEAVRLASWGLYSDWAGRYNTDLQLLAARQNALVLQLRNIRECSNSLHISDHEIPLYTGTASDTSANARFYASSHYLAGLATIEINTAKELLTAARNAYVSQRLSSFQTNRGSGSTENIDRKNALMVNYEDQLKRYCGAAPGDLSGGHPLIDGFRSGSIKETNCFLKLERSGCNISPDLPLKQIPDSCMRGEIGERIIAMKSAAIDADNAQSSHERAQSSYDKQIEYCIGLRTDADGAIADLTAHQNHMRSLNEKLERQGFLSSLVGSAISLTATAVTGGASSLVKFGSHTTANGEVPDNGYSTLTTLLGFGSEAWQNDLKNLINDEKDKYEQEVITRQGNATVMACYHAADQLRFETSAATDTILRATSSSDAALFAVNNDMNTVAGIAGQARGQLALEDSLNRTPPQFHYWLDQSIADYDKHMAYARRMTYLALRSYEYETQTDPNLRGATLSARLPTDLESVIHVITALSSTIAGGLDTKISGLTFSLRDEIMQVQATANLTRAQVFTSLLTADESKIYVGDGANRHLLGHGIRFTIKPDQWNSLFCDERIWRITPLATVTGGVPTLNTITMFHSNSFGSQTCTATPSVNMTRVQQNANLLLGDAPVDFSAPPAMFGTPVVIDSQMTAAQIHALPDGGGIDSSMAGRGLYGDYIIVFPDCDPAKNCQSGYTPDKLKSITDVTIRFDVAYAGNTRVLNNP